MDQGRAKSTMATGPAVTCMKTLLMVFNFLFWITGIVILALGIWTKVDLYKYMELSSIYYRESPYVLIGVGAVIVLVGSLGCCCTIKGNSILLYMYAVFLVVVFIVELSAGAAGFVYQSKLESGFKEGLEKALHKYKVDTEITGAMDDLQSQLKCCGIHSYSDWVNRTTTTDGKIPTSCCIDLNKCSSEPLPENVKDWFSKGCYSTVVDFMQSNMGLIGGVALGISFFQVFGALLSCCLARNINKAKYEQVA
ncbi:tetraspanin-7-like [Pecten maximus]|uniref:tetraspanin-7-like n=1 Tax=Pecten maximus TaxID=6579 RepID=UPI0014582E24|nr:tetraspanin-7-like [Pecten maximus]